MRAMPQASVNGTDLFYLTVGSGPPLLAMHGGLGLDHTSFRPWLAPLPDSASFRRLWRTLLPLYFHRYWPEMGEAMDRETRYAAAAFNAGMFRCLPKFDTVARLRAIATPTLILNGRDDWITPVAEG